MKRTIFIVSIIFLSIACGKQDKQSQLTKLISQRDKLNEQIANMQKDMAATGTNGVKGIPVDVSVTDLKPTEFNHYIEVQGKVDGEDNVSVTAKTIGVISKIFVKEGDNVKSGQVLAEMDAQVVKHALEELKSKLDFATNIYNKQKNLWDQKIGSEIQYLTAKNNKESLENSIATTKEQLALSSIISPINGTVEEVPVKVGQALQPGTIAFRVVNFSKIKVMAEVAEAFSPKVQDGDLVQIFFPDLNQEVSTRLNFTSKYINPVNRTFTVEARLDNSNYNFRANMIAVVKVNDYKAKNTFVVPVNVIQGSLEERYLYLAKEENGKQVAKKQKVTTGVSYNGQYEITSGLKENDKLITSGYQNLVEGQTIKISGSVK
ncbi:MAG: efflux RND transporter periplasmic adaptor subunit [Bacteroidia bacterium]|nr:efflux RND transporter periplasmic adaptor subunit [Bacteroidia bacterium]